MVAQFVDPSVSRAKVERELADYRALETEYRARGWFLLSTEFPHILVALAAPQLHPPAVVTGVLFDYTNYDAQPPSVRLVDPFTAEPYMAKDLPTSANRMLPASEAAVLPGLPPGARIQFQQMQPLMQWYGPEDIPFLCLAGVREYHAHPGHTGDSWELHRASGAGRLVRLLEVLWKYGVQPISRYGVAMVPQVTGFEAVEIPA